MKENSFDVSRAKKIINIATHFNRSELEIVRGACIEKYYNESYSFKYQGKAYVITLKTNTVELTREIPIPNLIARYRQSDIDPLMDREYLG